MFVRRVIARVDDLDVDNPGCDAASENAVANRLEDELREQGYYAYTEPFDRCFVRAHRPGGPVHPER